ncbi:hypothetical protein DPMN_010304 [Dreissena polymorpha]|uniref:Uncharacterized protein n=1 Tax=Dreissena polymorpha TaxID=45954 RepID=A0A9D4N240_DREPO|nr:hypothetical protein DPMN_010304 [Dreissena polymorpha]
MVPTSEANMCHAVLIAFLQFNMLVYLGNAAHVTSLQHELRYHKHAADDLYTGYNDDNGPTTCTDPANIKELAAGLIQGVYTSRVSPLVRATFPLTAYDIDFNFLNKTNARNVEMFCSGEKGNAYRMRRLLHYYSQADGFTPRKHELSKCPWVYFPNKDNMRIPAIIYEAKCVCDECSDTPINHKVRGTPASSIPGKCLPLFSSVFVFKKLCNVETGVFDIALTVETIATGCTCFHAERV